MALGRLLASLIVIAAVAFAIGVSLEDGEGQEGSAEEAAQVEVGEGDGEGAEVAGGVGETRAESSESEELLGIDLESTPLVVLAVVSSLALAAAVWLRPDLSALVLVVGVAMLGFAVLDVREVFGQLDESNSGLALLAGLIAATHGAAAAIAFKLATSADRAAVS